MSATGKQPLPRSIVAMVVAVDGMTVPDDVGTVLSAATAAVGADKPRSDLNRRFGQLRHARPGIFYRLHSWLARPEVKYAARRSGANWSWRVWLEASIKIHEGCKAHAAFGMNAGGRPKSGGFTAADDAAIYAVHSSKSGQVPDEGSAVDLAAVLYQARVDEIQKALPMARALPASSLAAAVRDSESKRR